MDWQLFQILVAALTVAAGALAIALAIRWHHVRADLKLREFEIRHRVFEKFADSQAFLDFARSEEGRRLLSATAEPARNPWRAGLGLLSVGLLVLALGIGAKISSANLPEGKELWERLAKQNMATWGTLSLCAGIALTASGVLARWLDRR
ncbi:MAG TPA: hypothetical protein VFV19_02935 [Candidatus Polarisedimenticolaceae bacterium]|nr:hypothetical protein [Candidatus Polarisedimenticolaceae bacterium]